MTQEEREDRTPTGRPCRVCQHPDRASIEQAIVNGKALREIARTFQVGYGEPGTDTFYPDHKVVSRHLDKCMGDAYRVAKADDILESGKAMTARLQHLDVVVDEQIERVRQGHLVYHDGIPLTEPDGQGGLREVRKYDEASIRGAVREARRNLELRSRLAGVTPEGDPDAVDGAVDLLKDPAARARISELEGWLAGITANGPTSVQGNE